jgi:KDO2-lipid IV(A) lauroyltransferase
MPVFFAQIRKVKRGYYEATLLPLVTEPRETSPGEITKMYMKALEDQILCEPQYWLWSHRRWKHKRS